VGASNSGRRLSSAAGRAGHVLVPRGVPWKPLTGGVALCLGFVIAQPEAHAGECKPPTPACHLKNGEELLKTDPKRAAEELLASFKLDERTDTLALYATALEGDRQYALALETWQRVIVFRESELDAAKANARKASGKKAEAARAAVKAAEKGNEQAAEAIIRLWSNVGRAQIRIPAGQQVTVTRGGVEVDATKDVLVSSGRDELVFTRKDGSSQSVVVQVAAGGVAKVDAPDPAAAKPASKPPQKIEQPRPTGPETPAKPAPTEPDKPVELVEVKPQPAGPEQDTGTPRSRGKTLAAYGLAAGAVVLGGVAGTFGYLASQDYDKSRDLGCSPDGQCPFGPAADRAERSNDRARVAQITAVAGGAMLVTGAVLWYLGRGKPGRPATEVTLHVAPSSAAVAWRF